MVITVPSECCHHCYRLNPNSPLQQRSSGSNHGGRPKQWGRLKKILSDGPQKPDANPGSSAKYSKICALDKPGFANKRAVLCGVSYKKFKYKLKGVINDVMNMKNLLIQVYGFREENIVVLTEEQKNDRHIPTKASILYWLRWLVKDCGSGDSLVFYFSGHGLRQPDFSKDELDGFDETICSVDFLREGMILDDEICATIVKPLPWGVTLHAIFDACHSGTILDLEHVYDKEKKKWIRNCSPWGMRKQTSGGKAYCISACQDDQLAADTSAFSSKTMNGVMTFILMKVVQQNLSSISYGELLDEIHRRIEEINHGCLFGNSRILSKIFSSNLTQKPILSASEEFDIYVRQFKL